MVLVKIVEKIESTVESYSVYVSNLNLKKETTEEEIQKHFESCGKILKIEKNEQWSSDNKNENKPKDNTPSYAIIYFDSLESVRNAVKLTNSKLNGKKIRVDFNVEGSKKIVKNLKKTQKIENMIHVSNLKFETTRFEIEDLFNTIGKVVSINMPANKNGRV
jgi:RNA recognition motif-containing protein